MKTQECLKHKGEDKDRLKDIMAPGLICDVCDNSVDTLNFRMFTTDTQTLPLQENVMGDNICKCCAVVKIEHFWKTTLFRIFLSRGHMSILSYAILIQQGFQNYKKKNILKKKFSNPLDSA